MSSHCALEPLSPCVPMARTAARPLVQQVAYKFEGPYQKKEDGHCVLIFEPCGRARLERITVLPLLPISSPPPSPLTFCTPLAGEGALSVAQDLHSMNRIRGLKEKKKNKPPPR